MDRGAVFFLFSSLLRKTAHCATWGESALAEDECFIFCFEFRSNDWGIGFFWIFADYTNSGESCINTASIGVRAVDKGEEVNTTGVAVGRDLVCSIAAAIDTSIPWLKWNQPTRTIHHCFALKRCKASLYASAPHKQPADTSVTGFFHPVGRLDFRHTSIFLSLHFFPNQSHFPFRDFLSCFHWILRPLCALESPLVVWNVTLGNSAFDARVGVTLGNWDFMGDI